MTYKFWTTLLPLASPSVSARAVPYNTGVSLGTNLGTQYAVTRCWRSGFMRSGDVACRSIQRAYCEHVKSDSNSQRGSLSSSFPAITTTSKKTIFTGVNVLESSEVLTL